MSFTGKTKANTYKDILQMNNSNSGIDTTVRNVVDGEGTASSISISDDNLQLKPVNDDNIFDIATIAANNDAYLGKLIWQALNAVGRDGIITVEESPNYKTNLIVREGLEIDEGFLSHLMANGEDGKATYTNPLIFTSNLNIRNFNMIYQKRKQQEVEKEKRVSISL